MSSQVSVHVGRELSETFFASNDPGTQLAVTGVVLSATPAGCVTVRSEQNGKVWFIQGVDVGVGQVQYSAAGYFPATVDVTVIAAVPDINVVEGSEQ